MTVIIKRFFLPCHIIVLKIIGGILAWLAGVWLVGKAIDSAYDTPDFHKPSKTKRKKKAK